MKTARPKKATYNYLNWLNPLLEQSYQQRSNRPTMNPRTKQMHDTTSAGGTIKTSGVCEGPHEEHRCDLDTPHLHDCGEECHDPSVPRNGFGTPIPGPDDVHYLNDGCDAPHGQGTAPLDLSTG